MSVDIVGKTSMVQSLQGEKLTVNATNGVMVEQGTVTLADLEASNGVIHVIDQAVLLK